MLRNKGQVQSTVLWHDASQRTVGLIALSLLPAVMLTFRLWSCSHMAPAFNTPLWSFLTQWSPSRSSALGPAHADTLQDPILTLTRKQRRTRGTGFVPFSFQLWLLFPLPTLSFLISRLWCFFYNIPLLLQSLLCVFFQKMEGEELNLFVKNIENVMSVTEKVRCSAKLLSSEHTHDPVSCFTKIQPMSTSPNCPLPWQFLPPPSCVQEATWSLRTGTFV